MTGDEDGFIAHRPQPLLDGGEQRLVIAQGEIRPTDRAGEQYVADQGQVRGRMVEDDMPRSVSGRMVDGEGKIANGDFIALVKPAVWLERPGLDPIPLTVLGQLRNPITVCLVRPLDQDPQLLGEHAGLPAMVDMPVGQQDLLDLYAGLPNRIAQLRQVAAGVHERPFIGRRAPDQRTVLLQRRNRDDRGTEGRESFGHVGHLAAAVTAGKVAIEDGTSFIERATASAPRMTRSTLPPASLARFGSDHPRRISSANRRG